MYALFFIILITSYSLSGPVVFQRASLLQKHPLVVLVLVIACLSCNFFYFLKATENLPWCFLSSGCFLCFLTSETVFQCCTSNVHVFFLCGSYHCHSFYQFHQCFNFTFLLFVLSIIYWCIKMLSTCQYFLNFLAIVLRL